VAIAYAGWASVQTALGRTEEARYPLERAIEHGETFAREHPEDAAAQASLANSYYNASLDAGNRGASPEALELVRRARAIQERLHSQNPLDQSAVRGLLFSLNGEGLHLRSLGHHREAVEVYRDALDVAQEMLRRDAQDRWAQAAVTVAYGALGEGLALAEQPDAGLEALREGRRIGARLVAEDPANGFVRNELAVLDANIGFALLATGSRTQAQEACRALGRAGETWRELQQLGPLSADANAALRRVDAELARCGSASEGG
jgi:tetratricopeptide (TPR) repeat protein